MKRLLLVIAAAAGLLHTQDALAFCRATTCNPSKEHCNLDPQTECVLSGTPLVWASDCITVNVQSDAAGKRGIGLDDAEASVRRAFDTWLAADCGQGKPSIEVVLGEPVACDAHEYTARRNANIIMFRVNEWPYEGGEDALGVTWLTYDIENKPGELWDADIELNAVSEPISVGDPTSKQVDLDSLITHELGHLLGLGHTLEPNATMGAGYALGSTDLRSLTADDVAGICAIYPAGRVTSSQGCEPRHGFSELCSSEQPPESQTPEKNGADAARSSSSCGLAATGNTPSALWLATLASTLCWRKRRRA